MLTKARARGRAIEQAHTDAHWRPFQVSRFRPAEQSGERSAFGQRRAHGPLESAGATTRKTRFALQAQAECGRHAPFDWSVAALASSNDLRRRSARTVPTGGFVCSGPRSPSSIYKTNTPHWRVIWAARARPRAASSRLGRETARARATPEIGGVCESQLVIHKLQ